MTSILQQKSNECSETILYEHQLDQIFLWLENWNEEQISQSILFFARHCSLTNKRYFCTILEPLLHRDFIYHGYEVNSLSPFKSFSSFISREKRIKLEREIKKSKTKNIYRIKSAHVNTEEDVCNWSKHAVLPSVKSPKKNTHRNKYKDTHHIDRKTINAKQNDSDIWINSTDTVDDEKVKFSNNNANNKVTFNNRINIDSSSKLQTKELFQSPSRSTQLKRCKQQILPDLKQSCHSRLLLHTSPASINEFIFDELRLSLKTAKRHLQHISSKDRNINRFDCQSKSGGIFKIQNINIHDVDEENVFIFQWFNSWTSSQQQEFLKLFLKLLTSPQLYRFYGLLMVRLYCDFVHVLPKRLTLKIFSYLKPKQLKICCKVNSSWRCACSNNFLWEKVCVKNFVDYIGSSCYMDAYIKHKTIEDNWNDRKPKITEKKLQNGSVLAMDTFENLLATGGTDRVVNVWSLDDFNTSKCVCSLEGHTRSVWDVKFLSKLLLISCSGDHTIKIWNIQNISCVRTIRGHDSAIWCLLVRDDTLFSGSADRSVKQWNLRSCVMMTSFTPHPGGVYAIEVSDDGSTLFAGTVDRVIRVWSLLYRICTNTIKVDTYKSVPSPIVSLSWNQGFLLACCYTSLQLWNTTTLTVVKHYKEAHRDRITSGILIIRNVRNQSKDAEEVSLEQLDGKMITTCKDGKVKVWNLNSNVPVQNLCCDDGVNVIQCDNRKIIAGTQDGTVKLFSFR